MSVFKDDESHSQSGTEEEITSYVQKLVETRGEQWKDAEVIAKGKLEADRYIEELKRKNEELLEASTRNSKVDELIELVRQQTKGKSTDSRPDDEATGGASSPDRTGPELTNEQIKALVEEQLKEYDSTRSRQSNLEFVEKEISKLYGESSKAVVRNTADEIGVSIEDLEEMAAKNPKLLLKLVSSNHPGPNSPTYSSGSNVRSEAVRRNAPGRNFEYYQKLRRENRSKYNSTEVQKQMLQDRLEMGDKFYKT